MTAQTRRSWLIVDKLDGVDDAEMFGGVVAADALAAQSSGELTSS